MSTENAGSSPASTREHTGPIAARRRPLRLQLALAVTAALAVTFTTIAIVGTRMISQREDQGARRGLHLHAQSIARAVDPLVREHLRAVTSVAREFSDATVQDAATLVAILGRTRQIYPGFLTMLATDSSGRVIASAPTVDSAGRPIVDGQRTVADRTYFSSVMRTGETFVSDVFLGRGFGNDPIVALSAALAGRGGRHAGIVEGSLDLSTLSELEGPPPPVPTDVLLLDARDRVIFASRGSGYATLQVLEDAPLAQARRQAGDSAFEYREGSVDYLATSVRVAGPNWHVVVRQRVRDVRRTTTSFLRTLLVSSLGILALCIFVAWHVAGRVTRPLESLDLAVRGFLTHGTRALPKPGRGTPREVVTLIEGFHEMQGRIGQTLSGLLPVCAWCRRIREDDGEWMHMEAYVSRRTRASFTHGICPACRSDVEERS